MASKAITAVPDAFTPNDGYARPSWPAPVRKPWFRMLAAKLEPPPDAFTTNQASPGTPFTSVFNPPQRCPPWYTTPSIRSSSALSVPGVVAPNRLLPCGIGPFGWVSGPGTPYVSLFSDTAFSVSDG